MPNQRIITVEKFLKKPKSQDYTISPSQDENELFLYTIVELYSIVSVVQLNRWLEKTILFTFSVYINLSFDFFVPFSI